MNVLNIVFASLERDRIIYSIKSYRPQKVVFFKPCINQTYNQLSSTSALSNKIADDLIKKIKFLVETEVVEVDYSNYHDCLFSLKKILEEAKNFDEIIINISSGCKFLIISASVLSQFFPCKLVYAIPQKYNTGLIDESNVTCSGVIDSKEIIPFNLRPFVTLKGLNLKLLKNLSDNKISLSKLTNNLFGDLDDYTKLKKKNLILYHIKKMSEKNLINKESINGESFFTLSELGLFVKNLKQ